MFTSFSQNNRRFTDGKRSVDFVLAYKEGDTDEDAESKRTTFENNLKREGLELEYNEGQWGNFIKLHAPMEVLYRYAEILKIKMPLKIIPGQEQIIAETTYEIKTYWSRICSRLFRSVQFNNEIFPERESRIHMEFACKYLKLYDEEHPNYFDASTRYSIINFIMQRQNFEKGEETVDNLGIEKLVQDNVYLCAYTLHDVR